MFKTRVTSGAAVIFPSNMLFPASKQSSSVIMPFRSVVVRRMGTSQPRTPFTSATFLNCRVQKSISSLRGKFFTHNRGYVAETPLIANKEGTWRQYARTAVSMVVFVMRRLVGSRPLVGCRRYCIGSTPYLE